MLGMKYKYYIKYLYILNQNFSNFLQPIFGAQIMRICAIKVKICTTFQPLQIAFSFVNFTINLPTTLHF